MSLLKRSTSSISSISTMSSSDFDLQNDVTNRQLTPLPITQQVKFSVEEIKKNDVQPVIVTHINSPSDFYLHLIANDSILTTITNELNKFVRTECSVTHCIERSKYIIVITVFCVIGVCRTFLLGVVHNFKNRYKIFFT